jgi:hypothetical protein
LPKCLMKKRREENAKLYCSTKGKGKVCWRKGRVYR